MIVTLYNIPELNVERNNMIRFTSRLQRNNYLDSVPSKVFDIDSVGAKQNLWDLNIDVALYDNFRLPEREYNYAKIVQDSSQAYFYYILGWKELGSNQVSYTLQLDTLQMAFGVVGIHELDLDVTTNSQLITREHRDRFNFPLNRAIFNEVPESGDNSTPVVLTENTLEASSNVRARLVYKNRTDSKPVAYPYVESALSVSVVGADWIGTIYSSIPTSSAPHEEMYTWDGNFQYTVGSGTPNISVTVPATQFVKYERSALGTRHVNAYNKSNGTQVGNLFNVPAGRDLRIKVGNQSVQRLIVAPQYIELGTSWTTILANYQTINYAASSTKALPLWTEIDQYDAMTDRIIEVPYFHPFQKTFYEDGYGIFLPLETENNSSTNYTLKYRPTGTFDMTKVDKLRVKYNDPKLYTSQFAPVLLNMNGMAMGLKRESFTGGLPVNITIPIIFNYEILTPSTFNLKTSIAETYIIKEVDELRQTWQVNNEIASIKDEAYTYNQYYKDLDDKQRNVQESSATRNTYLNTLNQSLGVVGGMIAGGVPNPIQIAARTGQAAINISQTFMELSDKMKLNEIQAKQKYIGLLLSASQISGATLNFIKTFNGDKIREVQFGLRGHELEYWDNYFHKFGYEALDFKPITFRSRKYFNHIKAILDFKKKPYGLTSAAVQDIKNRFSEGVTVFHAIGLGSTIEINFAQDKENWEL